MNTSKFIQLLNLNSGKKLKFILPDQTVLSGDLHITEIQHHSVESVDCGGNSHSYNETVIQLLINEWSSSFSPWTTDKAIKIIDTVRKKREFGHDAEIFIEFGDSAHPTIKYLVDDVETSPEDVSIQMIVKPTACKPKINAGRQVAACC